MITDGGGSFAQIEVGDNPAGLFQPVPPNSSVTETTTFALAKGAAGRYLLV